MCSFAGEFRSKIEEYLRVVDVLNPSTIVLGNRQYLDFRLESNTAETTGQRSVHNIEDIYRKIKEFLLNPDTFRSKPIDQPDTHGVYIDDVYVEFNSDDDLEDVMKITRTLNGQYELTCNVSNFYFPFLIGRKQANLQKLEQKCDVKFIIPPVGNDINEIKIVGRTERLVISAKRILNLEISKIHSNQEPNYFLSIAVNNSEIKCNFVDFKKQITSGHYVNDLDNQCIEDMFIPVEKLHLTIGMLKLVDNFEKVNAMNTLMKCKETIFDPFLLQHGPIEFYVEGVESFEDDPTLVRVLFSKIVDENGQKHAILQELVDLVYDYFRDVGLINDRKELDNVKMHVTLMNTRYIKKRHLNDDFKDEIVYFNAESILNKFGKFRFGKEVVKDLHLSSRFTLCSSGYYGTLSIKSDK